MNQARLRRGSNGLRAAFAIVLAALLAACAPGDYNLPPCPTAEEVMAGAPVPSPSQCSNDSVAVLPGGGTLTATPQRFPVVTLSDNRDAIILSSGRQGDDRANPVHKFARTYRLEGGVFGAAADLAGTTSTSFVASSNADQSGGRDSLTSDASGQGVALWTAGNAGVAELYLNYYVAGFGTRELIATPGTNVLAHRVAMDGTGNLIAVWLAGDGVLRARDRLGSAPLGSAAVLPTGVLSALGDVAFTGFQANVIWTGNAREVFATRGIGATWETPVQIGIGLNGPPARLASHPDAPGFDLVAAWEDGTAIMTNSRNGAGWQSSTGSPIPGSAGGRLPQLTMAADGEVLAVWETDGGIFASRRVAGTWSMAERIGGGDSARVASDAAGNAIVVWVSGKTVRANRYVKASGWLGEQDIGGGRVGASRANVAMDQSGRGVVVWEREVTATTDPLDTEIAVYAFVRPVARFTASPNPAPVGAPVTFDAATSTGNGAAIASYRWDFESDGTFDATGISVTTSFPTAGTRSVRLRVVDAAGLQNDTTQTVTISGTTRSLNLQVVGAGGRATGSGGLDCRTGGVGSCQQTYLSGASVTLLAAADPGWQFVGWSGDCTGATPALTLVLDANRVCTAGFTAVAAATLSVTVIGSGTVASNPAGIACGADCSESYPLNTLVTLTATPGSGFSFSAWSGDTDCSDEGVAVPVARVTLTAAKSCTASFTAAAPAPVAAQHLAANNGSSYAVTAGGVAYSWGSDGTGALGNGGADTNLSIATPMGTLTGVRAIGAGLTFGVAALTDGTVWAWGYSGSTFCVSGGVSNSVPVQVAAASNAVAVSGGGSHTVILRGDGTVQAFGCNFAGQLGRSGTAPSASAVTVAGLTGITAVAAGDTYSLALKSDGTVWSWGMGPLGDGVSPPPTRFTPAAIVGLSNVIAIAAGAQHALALKNDGSVWAWGSNTNGKLGDGTLVNRWAPVPTLLTSQITAIAASAEFSLAQRSDGAVLAWGINETGQLGSGSSSPGFRPEPAPVVSLGSVVAIVAGSSGLDHALAVRSDGSVWAWGWNGTGQLGNGTTGPSTFATSPVQVTGLNLN